jgi:hypothetical protein
MRKIDEFAVVEIAVPGAWFGGGRSGEVAVAAGRSSERNSTGIGFLEDGKGGLQDPAYPGRAGLVRPAVQSCSITSGSPPSR